MATTTNFGWTTPNDTDLVKDGASAIRTLGSGIDTSLVKLKGGTTGQVLAKATNTDLDYTWTTPEIGDITAVTAGTGLSGGGTTGAVSLAIDSTVATLTGTQTLTNKTLTSPVLTTPTISTIDAKGDLLVGTADNTIGRLAVGTNNQVLIADSTTGTGLKWGTVGGGGKVLQVVMGEYSTATTIASTTFTNTGLEATITPSSTTSKILIFISQPLFVFCTTGSDSGAGLIITRNGTAITSSSKNMIEMDTGASGARSSGQIPNRNYLDSPATTSAVTYRAQTAVYATSNGRAVTAQFESTTAQIILMEIGA